MRLATLALPTLLFLTLAARADDPPAGPSLAAPFRAEAAGKPIDLEDGTGHAAPLMVDWDGDGLKDLLVGQFDGGWLRIYRNAGKKGAPAFKEHEWFAAGGARAQVETG